LTRCKRLLADPVADDWDVPEDEAEISAFMDAWMERREKETGQ